MSVTITPLDVRLARRLRREPNGCLVWTGALSNKGYGEMSVPGRGGRPMGTHRVAWILAHPGEPPPQVVRHSCDNPPCCEPTHLLAGTYKDNSRDAIERGRYVHAGGRPFQAGERHWNVKLSDEQVAAIRSEYAAGGVSQRALGDRYGVSDSTVCLIVKGRRRS